MEETHIVTVDLGTHKLGISVCRVKNGQQPEVIVYNDYPSRGISHGKVLNPTRLSEALRYAFSNIEDTLKIKITQAVVNLQKFDVREEDFSCTMNVTSGRSINSEDVETLGKLAWSEAEKSSEGDEIYGMVAQCFETQDELGVSANDIVGMVSPTLSGKYKVYLGKGAMRGNIEEAFNLAGVKASIAFVPDKVGEAVLTQTQMDGGVALLDMGAGATSVSVFYSGELRHYGAIPFGGDSITGDIRNLCGIEEHLAENIKMGYGGCMPDRLGSLGEKTLKISNHLNSGKIEITTKYLSEIITARVQEILEAMLYEIQKSGYADMLKNGIVVVGGCANMLNLCVMIRQISGYSAKVGAALKKQVNAKSEFFYPAAAASAGLVMSFNPNSCTECTEPVEEVRTPAAGTVSDTSDETAPENGGGLFAAEEMGEGSGRKKTVNSNKGKDKGKDRKKGGISFPNIFTTLFDDDENENKL